MLVTAVIKTRTEILHGGGFAGRVTAVSTGEERSFTDCDDLVAFLAGVARTQGSPRKAVSPAVLGELTPRQRQVLGLVAAGYTNAELASELRISVGTVRKHLERIFRAIGARNRTDAAARLFGQEGAVSRIDPGDGHHEGWRHASTGPWRSEGDEAHTRQQGSEGARG